MTWTEIEDALWGWVKGASGLADGQVVFANQKGLVPEIHPFVVISVGQAVSRSADESLHVSTNTSDRTVTQKAVGWRTLTVTLSAFSNSVLGEDSGPAILSRVQIGLRLGLYRDMVNAAGLGLVRQGDVGSLPKIEGFEFESQALLELQFCVALSAEETIPYIEAVNGDGTVHNPGSDDIDVPFTGTPG